MSDKSRGKEPGMLTRFLTQIKKVFGLNIGTMIFGVLFLYMVFGAVMYLTSSHIDSYQVTSGPLSRNETYTGLAIRKETVCKADSSGYVNYYAREGSKINAGGAVYGLSATKIPEAHNSLSHEELSKIRNDMLSFSKSFNPSKFNSTYSFKYRLEGSILQYAGVTSPDADAGSGVVTLGNQNISKSDSDGIVLYSWDGYEDKQVQTLTAADFDQNSYHETDLKTQGQVKTGDNIYTIITDERWNLVIPLSDKQAAKLADRTYIRVKFLKDGMTQSGSFSILEIDGLKYGNIGFNRGLIRYASDRFLDIELVTNTVSGLKIPLSSIVTKEFFTIPSAYEHDKKNGEIGFMKADKNKDGENITSYIIPRIYGSIEDPEGEASEEDPNPCIYYVDKSSFQEGDAIIKDRSGEKYIVGPTEILEGVYCINQGYAVFRRVEILDQNEEYAIVAKNTSFGLARYDHIVRNGTKVREEDILY